MASRKYPSKYARVEVETRGLDLAIKRLEEEGVEAAQQAFADAVEAQRKYAYSEWGVDTGEGRESLTVVASRRGTTFAVRIFSKHKPLRYQSWTGKRPTFWSVLVLRPLKKIAKKLTKEAARRMALEVERGR